ncbi:translation elongation factor EF-1alpha/Tu [Reticulomyxa filosa]|uniref:Translation elongation factor EF-1alpha/Tu n=1 Tax=Reticulomyxa filosa TaxID=46433 RepID=X6LYZ6_RETFI|nr:translation elongation factor EF-1alpha/Tu [Reticulomyxa filosa]|eukprot:ETO05940.1 translation elongation factor EF-1alpha/Tu [Reticulomyxa filosa]
MLFKFFYAGFFNASFLTTNNKASVTFAHRKQKSKSIRSKSWKQIQNGTKNHNSTIEPTVKKDQIIGWQVCGPRSRARDWTIGKILMKKRYSFASTAEKETLLDVYKKLHVNYELLDGQIITVGAERVKCLEIVFKLNFTRFETLIAKGSNKKREIQEQIRQHARLCYLFGIEQVIACVSKMDCPSINYAQDRFEEIKSTSCIYNIKGLDDVATGRIEQGTITP